MFNNDQIIVQDYTCSTDKLTGNYVVAHLSDVHEKEFGAGNRLLFDAVARVKPDIIVFTGDIAKRKEQPRFNKPYTTTFARGLAHIAPTYVCLGNHELQYEQEVRYILMEHDVTVLDGQVETRVFGQDTINLSGMSDEALGVKFSARADSMLGAEGYNIFLTHRPEYFDGLSGRNIDLVLAGHTHAGQIRFPKFGAFAVSGQGMFPKYVQGKFEQEAMQMIISRGLGASGYPTIRINNPPELVCVHICGTKQT